MPEQNLIIFALLGLLGLAIIILGFKFSEKTKKVIETTGAIVFHVGVFGILYHKVSLNLFISLVALVVSLFILIDPLKIGDYLNNKIYRLFGYITLFAAFAFSLDFFSGFPVWLWAIPLVIYLSPYLVSPLRKYQGMILALSWLVVFSYVGLISYVIYAKYNPSIDVSLIQRFLPQLQIPTNNEKFFSEHDLTYHPAVLENKIGEKTPSPPSKGVLPYAPTVNQEKTVEAAKDTSKGVLQYAPTPDTTPVQNTPTLPSPTGPYLESLKEADSKFLKLQIDFEEIKSKYEKVLNENKKMVDELEDLKGKKSATETL